jgi:hypothetical protein
MIATDPIVVESPPRVQSERVSEFDIPEEVIERLRDNVVIVRHGDWTVLHRSNGETRAWLEREPAEPAGVPDDLVTTAEDHCERLSRTVGDQPGRQPEFSDEVEERLKDLGYK